MNSQITGTMLGCKIFAPSMINNKKGSIINISSASAGPPIKSICLFSSKSRYKKFDNEDLAREWADYNLRVNAIRPGFFPTEWNKKHFITKEREEAILNHTPMKRYGISSELIGATIWLASNASSFVTGTEVTVDGDSHV